LPQNVVETLDGVELETASHENLLLVLAVGYGGQDEIVRATKRALSEGVDPETLDEKEFLSYCDTGDVPPPDLIVRTGGDLRHSGYFLYQAEYSEYFFSDLLWPDFNRDEFDRAVSSLKSAKRNFGK
jgi:undecaprenyl diphosphate synthase